MTAANPAPLLISYMTMVGLQYILTAASRKFVCHCLRHTILDDFYAPCNVTVSGTVPLTQ